MAIFRTACLLIALALPALSFSKTLPSIEKMDKVSQLFMTQVQNGDIETAFSIMSAYLGVNMEQFLERAKKVDQDMKQFQQSVGKPLSYALLDKQAVGEHFYKITYLLKYESAALIWELNFYQPDQGWKLVDISFNANINELFK